MAVDISNHTIMVRHTHRICYPNATIQYTVAESNGTTVTTSQSYCAYGRKRTTSGGNTNCSSSNSLLTDHTFTGQKYDNSGLQFFNARYYDPQIGTFISPDTIVPNSSKIVLRPIGHIDHISHIAKRKEIPKAF